MQRRVIAFNDFHGHLEPGNLSLPLPDPDQPGGVQRVAAGGAMTMLKLLLLAVLLLLSVARMTMPVLVPAVVGVPLMTPVLLLSESPAGKVPENTL